MKIKIGIFGVTDSTQVVMDIVRNYPEIEPIRLCYTETDTIIPVFSAREAEADMWLFIGRIAYLAVQDWGQAKRPVFHLPYKGASLYRTLCQILCAHKIELDQISFDAFDTDELKMVFAEMGVETAPQHVRPYRLGSGWSEISEYHYELWQRGLTRVAVTGVDKVRDILETAGVPVFRALPARSAVDSMLTFMLRSHELKLARDAQIAVQLIEFDAFSDIGEYASTDDLYAEEIKTTQTLIDYSKRVQGSLKQAGFGRYAIFTTRGWLSACTDAFSRIPDFEELERLGLTNLTCGIGIGASAYEAEFHAAKALINAKSHGKGCWLVVDDDKTVTGPLGAAEQTTYSYGDEKLRPISDRTSISIATLSKIESLLRALKRTEISAQELAQHLRIQPRSARRILAELEKSGIAARIGDEAPNPRGRPRSLYQLKF